MFGRLPILLTSNRITVRSLVSRGLPTTLTRSVINESANVIKGSTNKDNIARNIVNKLPYDTVGYGIASGIFTAIFCVQRTFDKILSFREKKTDPVKTTCPAEAEQQDTILEETNNHLPAQPLSETTGEKEYKLIKQPIDTAHIL